MTKEKLPYIWAGIAVIFWGTLSTSVKALLDVYSEMEFLCISSFLVFLFLMIINLLTGRIGLFKDIKVKDYLIMAGFGILGTFLYNYFYNFGIHRLTSQEACIINYLWPIMVMVFGCLILGDRLTIRKLLAIIISFVGVMVIVTKLDFLNFHPNSLSGVFACLAAAVCYGLYCALNKLKAYDQFIALSVYYLVTFVISGIFMIHGKEFGLPHNGLQVAATLFNGLVSNGAGYLFWNLALVKGDTAKISNIAFLTPFLSILFARIFLREAFSIYALIGLLIIMLGIFIQLGDGNQSEKEVKINHDI